MPVTELTPEEIAVALRVTDRPCENPLCDTKLCNFQARFCTRCWKAIEVCRAIEAKWKAAKK